MDQTAQIAPTQEPAFSPPRAEVPRKQILIAAVVAVLLSLMMNAPIASHLTTDVAGPNMDPGYTDSLIAAWEISWDGYAITHHPLHLWQSNVHYPLHDGLAFHDSLLGYGIPFGWMGETQKAAIIRFNLLFLFAYALAFFGAWLLARELGVGPLAAAIAGVMFAFAPWRLSQSFHLHVLSSGGIPLSLFFMFRGFRLKNPWLVGIGWLIATWQVSLGFSTGLLLAYLLGGLGVMAAAWWLLSGRPSLDRRVIAATALGFVVFGGYAVWQSRPYLRVAHDHPEADHTVKEVNDHTPPPSGLLVAPEQSLVWGKVSAVRRSRLGWPMEMSIFPGALAIALGAFGLLASTISARRRLWILLVIVVTGLLSMGLRSPFSWMYKLLYDHAPGWQGVRTPGRITTITTLAIGVLAAGAAQWIFDRLRVHGRALATTVLVLAAAGALLEGAGRIDHTTPPPVPVAQRNLAGPLMNLPSDAFHDMQYMFWSIGRFPKIVNGHAVFIPAELDQLRHAVAGFPDTGSVAALRQIHVREVIWHRRFAKGTVWETADRKPIDGLGISKHEEGDEVIFDL